MEQVRDLNHIIECTGISKEFTNERGTTRVVDHFDLKVSENEVRQNNAAEPAVRAGAALHRRNADQW